MRAGRPGVQWCPAAPRPVALRPLSSAMAAISGVARAYSLPSPTSTVSWPRRYVALRPATRERLIAHSSTPTEQTIRAGSGPTPSWVFRWPLHTPPPTKPGLPCTGTWEAPTRMSCPCPCSTSSTAESTPTTTSTSRSSCSCPWELPRSARLSDGESSATTPSGASSRAAAWRRQSVTKAASPRTSDPTRKPCSCWWRRSALRASTPAVTWPSPLTWRQPSSSLTAPTSSPERVAVCHQGRWSTTSPTCPGAIRLSQ